MAEKITKSCYGFLNISEDKLLIENRDVVIQAKELVVSSGAFCSNKRSTKRLGSLVKEGITTVYLEDLDPWAQAKLFNQVKVIIGPHGSRFTNLVCKARG